MHGDVSSMEEIAVNFTVPDASGMFSKQFGTVFGLLLLTECVLGKPLVTLSFAVRFVPFTTYKVIFFNL